MKLIKVLFLMVFICFLMYGCGGKRKVSDSGKQFNFHSEQNIFIGQTTKKQIFDIYGQPFSVNVQGKYQVLKYHHEQLSYNPGINPLTFVPIIGFPVLLADIYSDKDYTEVYIRDWETMVFYVDLVSGVVKDYYYHDSKLKGHDDSESLYLISLKLIENGKNSKAIEILEKAITLNPNNYRALNKLAWQLIDLEVDIDKGLKIAQKAVAVFPDSPHSNGTLGVGYFKQGKIDKAEECLLTAIKLFRIYAPQDIESIQYDKAILAKIEQKKHLNGDTRNSEVFVSKPAPRLSNENPNEVSYFPSTQDGDQWTTESHRVDSGGNISNNTEYGWNSGFEIIAGVKTAKKYFSSDRVGGHHHAISYIHTTQDESRLYRTETFGKNPGEHNYNPYLPVRRNLEIGQTYEYSYLHSSTWSALTSHSIVYTNIEYDSVSTHYDVYDDCIKYEVEYPSHTRICWAALSIGNVRCIEIINGIETTTDYKYTYH